MFERSHTRFHTSWTMGNSKLSVERVADADSSLEVVFESLKNNRETTRLLGYGGPEQPAVTVGTR